MVSSSGRRRLRGALRSALVEGAAGFLESAAASAVHPPLGVHNGTDNTNKAKMSKLFIGSLDAILSDWGAQKFFPRYPFFFQIISEVRFIRDTDPANRLQ